MKRILSILMTCILLVAVCGCGGINHVEKESENMLNYKSKTEEQYVLGLGCYLNETLNLSYFDEMLSADRLGFIPLGQNEQCDSQKKYSFGLKYIYMRNDLHLERLSEEEMKLSRSMIGDNKVINKDVMSELMEKSLGRVITPIEINPEEDKEIVTIYDMTLDPDFVTMDTLVIRIATKHNYDARGDYVDEANEIEKRDALKRYAEAMESDMKGKIEAVPVKVFIDYIK